MTKIERRLRPYIEAGGRVILDHNEFGVRLCKLFIMSPLAVIGFIARKFGRK